MVPAKIRRMGWESASPRSAPHSAALPCAGAGREGCPLRSAVWGPLGARVWPGWDRAVELPQQGGKRVQAASPVLPLPGSAIQIQAARWRAGRETGRLPRDIDPSGRRDLRTPTTSGAASRATGAEASSQLGRGRCCSARRGTPRLRVTCLQICFLGRQCHLSLARQHWCHGLVVWSASACTLSLPCLRSRGTWRATRLSCGPEPPPEDTQRSRVSRAL